MYINTYMHIILYVYMNELSVFSKIKTPLNEIDKKGLSSFFWIVVFIFDV